MNTTTLVQKPWNHCNILCDDGLNCDACTEQLAFLPFLNLADERESCAAYRSRRLHVRRVIAGRGPEGCPAGWTSQWPTDSAERDRMEWVPCENWVDLLARSGC